MLLAALRVLRSEAKRFVLRVHPDVLHHLPTRVRETNQRSLQALNSALDEAHSHCGDAAAAARRVHPPAPQQLPFYFDEGEPRYVTVGAAESGSRERQRRSRDQRSAWLDHIVCTVSDLLRSANIAPTAALAALLSERQEQQQQRRRRQRMPLMRGSNDDDDGPTITLAEVAAALVPAMEEAELGGNDASLSPSTSSDESGERAVERARWLVRSRASAFGESDVAASVLTRLRAVLATHAVELDLAAPHWDDVSLVLTTPMSSRYAAKAPRSGASTVVLPASASAERMLRVLLRHAQRRQSRVARREKRRELVDYLHGDDHDEDEESTSRRID